MDREFIDKGRQCLGEQIRRMKQDDPRRLIRSHFLCLYTQGACDFVYCIVYVLRQVVNLFTKRLS